MTAPTLAHWLAAVDEHWTHPSWRVFAETIAEHADADGTVDTSNPDAWAGERDPVNRGWYLSGLRAVFFWLERDGLVEDLGWNRWLLIEPR